MPAREIEPSVGLPAGTIGRLTSAGSRPALLGAPLLASLLQSESVVLSKLCACVKRAGGQYQGRRQALGGLPRVACCAVRMALAAGGLPLVRGLLPAISGPLAQLSLLEPGEAVSLLPGGVLLGGLLIAVALLAPIRGLFPTVGGLLSLVGDPVALVGDPVALVGDPVTLIGGVVACVGHPFAPVSHPRLLLRVAARLPTGSRRFMALCALFMHSRSVDVDVPV